MARAAQWRFAGALVGAASRLAIGVMLSRLLTPADFGVVAIAFVVLGFVQPLGDLGIGSAVVQRRRLTVRHLRAAFTFSTLVGVAVAVGLALISPVAALIMRDARVTPVLRVLATGFAVQGIAVVAGALLRRRLDFKRLFFIDTASYVLGYGVVAVSLAVLGKGVWSLVWGGLFQGLFSSVAQLAVARHSLRPLLAGREVRELLHFGVGAGTSTWINYLAVNADNFVVGRMLGAASLGLYARAYTLMNLPYTYAASVMSGVLFPAFAQMQADPARLRRAYLMLTQVTALVAAAAMGTMAIVAPHLVRSLYGAKWVGVVAPLQVLCAAGYFRALYHIGGIVAQSVGLVYSDLRRQVLYATLVVAGALVGSRYGLTGVAIGVSVAIVSMFAATGQLALRITGVRWRDYFGVQRDAIVIAAVTCASAFTVRRLLEGWGAPSGIIAAGILASAALPWCAGVLWKLGHPELHELKSRLPPWCGRPVELVRKGTHVARFGSRVE
jgi:O-antigen/teichoic acid export membrane protein